MVTVVGSANLDLVFTASRLPVPGETVLGAAFAMFPGGKGANQAAAVGRLGGRVKFVGNVGQDSFGDAVEASLRACGVDTAGLRRDPDHPTGTATIAVDANGQNAILVASGANMAFPPEHAEACLRHGDPGVTLLQLEVPDAVNLVAGAWGKVILNPAPARPIPDSLLARAWIVTPNEVEAEMLTGIAPTDEAALARIGASIIERGPTHVVVTLGARGAAWVSAAGVRRFRAPRVTPVDTTAAGDAFNGALALFLAEGQDLESAVPAANAAAALSVTRPGAIASMPTRAEWSSFTGALV